MTGLLDTPSVDPDGTIVAVSCIQPGLQPGGRVKIDCETLQGLYQVHQVKYVGDTTTDQWDAELECRP